MNLKSPEEILKVMLFKMFFEDFKKAKVCPSDTIYWINQDKEELNKYFEKWLVDEGYAEEFCVGDRIKTKAWINFSFQGDFIFGDIVSITNKKCLDGSEFKQIIIKFEDGRTLPCIEEELIKVDKTE